MQLPRRNVGLDLSNIGFRVLEQGARGLDVALEAATLTNSSRARQLLLDHGAVERPLGFSWMEASDYPSEDEDGF